MDKLTRWTLHLILALTCIHFAYGLTVDSPMGDVFGDGIVNGVGDDYRKGNWFWFMESGIGFTAIWFYARRAARETGRLPASAGIWMLILGAPMALLMPASGSWGLMAVGALALVASRRGGGDATTANTRAAAVRASR